jgi:hypothetical protein
MQTQETLRSSFTCDGVRIFLIHDAPTKTFRIGTRWYWLNSFESVWDACDAFEALQLMEGDEKLILRALKTEIMRNPRTRYSFHRIGMERVNYLISCAEKRLQGLRPVSCGSKGSVIRWVPA